MRTRHAEWLARARRALATDLTLGSIVNIAFVAILFTATTRYLIGHGMSPTTYIVVGLVPALGLFYLLAHARGERPRLIGSILTLVCWAPLVYVAPSFWACAFSLFFLARRRLPSVWIVVGITALCARALIVLSGSFDWTIIIGTGVVALLLSAVHTRIERDSKEQQRLIHTLTETQERLARTERLAGVLDERQRLSRELHDTVTQGLTSSLLMMEATISVLRVAPEGAERPLRNAMSLIRTSLAETRNLVHDLGSPRLDGIGLDDALHRVAVEVPGCRCSIEGEPRDLDVEMNHTILRVAQSALQNADRHAAASIIRVTLTYLPAAVILDVADDGIGFDPGTLGEPTAVGGYGLRAMRHRVEHLGGRFTVESTPGGGTIVVAALPTDTMAGTALLNTSTGSTR